uniref:(northern house mosquito) hypothetical protein n=1 Tax=Culex pipiens TaxID=7175 RepID=A0A8D8CMB0_CULPI
MQSELYQRKMHRRKRLRVLPRISTDQRIALQASLRRAVRQRVLFRHERMQLQRGIHRVQRDKLRPLLRSERGKLLARRVRQVQRVRLFRRVPTVSGRQWDAKLCSVLRGSSPARRLRRSWRVSLPDGLHAGFEW